MLSKTIEEWIEETTKYASQYYDKYADVLGHPTKYPREHAMAYCNVSHEYYKLSVVLKHLQTYGGIYVPEKCRFCNDLDHIKKIQTTYLKYEKWIRKLRPTVTFR